MPNQLPDIFYEEYPNKTEQLFSLYPGLEKRQTNAEADFLGDGMFGSKARFYVEQVAKTGQAAFLYLFKRVPPSSKQTVGAFHAAELPFVHGTHTPILPLTEQDWQLSAKMIDYWTQFAKTGNPNGVGRPKWEPFDSAQPRWMHLGIDKIGMVEVEREAKYQILNERTVRHIKAMKSLRKKDAATSFKV